MKHIIEKLSLVKNKNYARNIKYKTEDYIMEIISVIYNCASWRRHNGKIDGRVLNNKHNEYIKLGVYDELYKINLKKYLKKSNRKLRKYLSIDTSFIPNKYGKENIGRNIYYKNKQGKKLFAMVDNSGMPINFFTESGNRNDHKLMANFLDELEHNKKDKKFILADKGFDSKKIRERLIEKNYIPIIPKRKNKNKKVKSLNKKNVKIYKKRIIVENFFAWIKKYPKVGNIYEKTTASYNSILMLVFSMMLFKRTPG